MVFQFAGARMALNRMNSKSMFGLQHKHQPLHDKINPKDCQVASPLVIQGFSNFFGLFQGIMANPDVALWETNMAMENPPWMKMYFLLNMGDVPWSILSPVILLGCPRKLVNG